MSDETKKSSETESAKPAAPAAPAAKAPEPPPEPGEFGKLLETKGFSVKHLGPDAEGVERIDVDPANLLSVAAFLKDDSRCGFDLLVSVTGVDWKDRREAVYHLYSTETFKKLVVKATAVKAADGTERLPSLMPVWNAADWHEREAYDLMGIIFDGHENLKRILMPSDWIGYPLRKDYKEEDPRLVWNKR